MEKTIVCYFSASGTTKKVAEKLATMINSNLFEIVPVSEYTSNDLDWNNQNSRSSVEMNDDKCRVQIKNKLEDINDYENIIIGYPIWWGLAPRIINTLLENTNLENKKIYLFATSGGSGIDMSMNNLKKEYPNLNFVSGMRLSENMTNEEISSWLGE